MMEVPISCTGYSIFLHILHYSLEALTGVPAPTQAMPVVFFFPFQTADIW